MCWNCCETTAVYLYSVCLNTLCPTMLTETVIKKYKLHSRLTPDDLRDIVAFKLEIARFRALISRLLQRSCVAFIAQQDPLEIQIFRPRGHKPCSERSLGIDWNVSHDGVSLMLGVMLRKEKNCLQLGIDLMEFVLPQRHNCALSLIRSIKSQLTELELEWIIKGVDNVPEFPLHCCFTEEQKRLLRFLIIWTAKEAFLKACGSGIIYNLARLNVTPFRQQRPAVPLRDTITPAEKNTTLGFRVFPLPFVSLEKDGKPVQTHLEHRFCYLHPGAPPCIVCICVLHEGPNALPTYPEKNKVQVHHVAVPLQALLDGEQQWWWLESTARTRTGF